MRPVVRESWLHFTEPLEGGVPYLYADIRNLITIAFGNLVDPLSAALALPLVHPDFSPASPSEITAAWMAVKNDPKAAAFGHRYAAKLTRLRLTPEGMRDLALHKLAQNDLTLRDRLPNWEELPACAQLAMHSLAWACGAGAHFPRLFSAVKARDFDAASVEIHMNEWTTDDKGARILNAGLVPRNVANKILMRNAARVDAYHLDPDVLDWTHVLGISDAVTVPELGNPPSEPECE